MRGELSGSYFKVEDLGLFISDVLLAAGVKPADAAAITSGLLAATTSGMPSHGIERLSQYVESIKGGHINLNPQVKVLTNNGATSLIDADGGYGFRPSGLAIDQACKNVATAGIAIAGVRNSHHFGPASIFTREIASRGFIGIASSTSSPRVVGTGGKRPVLGNNPLSIAIPRSNSLDPILIDFATGMVAIGRLRQAARRGEKIPLDWGFDALGNATDNPESIINGGSLSPMGGHKGYGLGIMLEVLAGILTGSPFGENAHPHKNLAGGVGHIFIVINPEFLLPILDFNSSLESLISMIISSGDGEIRIPGLNFSNTEESARRDGIFLSLRTIEDLNQTAANLSISGITKETHI
jgi:LDH2 family malate/lactate/ureidoglycolate dehydrogenase